MRALVSLTLATLPALAAAHDGHGAASASHWHATDLWGFAALAAAVVGAVWWQRRK